MKLIFAIKWLSSGLNNKTFRSGGLALNIKSSTVTEFKGIHFVDRFLNIDQRERFMASNSDWKPIEIKKL